MNNLVWNHKSRSRDVRMCDVSIRLNKNGHDAYGDRKYSIVFRFNDDAVKKICAVRAYVIYAVDEENGRVYFKESDSVNGFKLTRTNKSDKKCYISSNTRDTDFWNEHIGDYCLLFDRETKLHYLDFSKKLR